MTTESTQSDSITQPQVKLFKLSSGETVVSLVLHTVEDVAVLKNPIEMRVRTTNPDKSTMVATQWIPLTEDNNIVYLSYNHVVATQTVTDYLLDFYTEAVQAYTSHLDYEEQEREAAKKELVESMMQLRELEESANTSYAVH